MGAPNLWAHNCTRRTCNHAVGIQHWHDLEHKPPAQLGGYGVGGVCEELQQPMQHVAGRCFARVLCDDSNAPKPTSHTLNTSQPTHAAPRYLQRKELRVGRALLRRGFATVTGVLTTRALTKMPGLPLNRCGRGSVGEWGNNPGISASLTTQSHAHTGITVKHSAKGRPHKATRA